MAKVSTKETSRTRAKNAAALEAVATSIAKLQELLVQAEDLKQEGFPYRDAVRARVELHVRECVKIVFGDRAPEAQPWRHYHVRATTPAEVTETLSQLHDLLGQLERKKLELLGVPPLPPVARPEEGTAAGQTVPAMDTTPPLAPPVPEAAPPDLPVESTGGVPVPPAGRQTTGPTAAPSPLSQAMSSAEALPLSEAAPSAQAPPSPGPPSTVTPQASAPQSSPLPPAPRAMSRPEAPIAPEPREQVRAAAVQAEAQTAAPRPFVPPDTIGAGERSPDRTAGQASATLRHAGSGLPSPLPDDPLETIRKLCARFHAIVRQLRLRREYRPTIDVEDERDVQDLMFALLRYELEEVSPHEWVPPYQNPTPSTAMVLPRHRLVVLAKKTRSGHGAREIAQELTADGQEFSTAAGPQSLVCFVYDPDGRIGNPRSLEADLTRVSDAQVLEVIIFPK